jgi:hypothetical protein
MTNMPVFLMLLTVSPNYNLPYVTHYCRNGAPVLSATAPGREGRAIHITIRQERRLPLSSTGLCGTFTAGIAAADNGSPA